MNCVNKNLRYNQNMKNIRWYDKNPDLKRLFEFIQELDENLQAEIAKDIIQILMTDFNLDLDAEIKNIHKNYNYECKRWYDENIDLFSSFEIIRNMPEKQQNQVVKKIIEMFFLMHFGK